MGEGSCNDDGRAAHPMIRSTLELATWEVGQGDSFRVRDCAAPAEEAARKFGYADVAPIVRDLAVAPDGVHRGS